MELSISDRVSNGAGLLDIVEPEWYKRINLITLDIALADRCVLGQLYGSYWLGVTELGFDDFGMLDKRLNHGFTSVPTIEMAELTYEWRNLIARRRLAEVGQPVLESVS